MGERGHHGSNAFLDKFAQHLAVGSIYIAYEAEVDTILDGTLMAADDIHVGTCKTESVDTIGLQAGHEGFVYETAIDHRYHTEHLCIGDSAAIDHLRLDAERLCHLRGLTTTTVNQYFLSLNGAEIFQQLCKLSLILDHSPTNLYYRNILFHLIQDKYSRKVPNDN